MRRLRNDSTPPLDEWTTMLLLVGRDPKRGRFLEQLMFTSPHPDNQRRIAALWREHEPFLLAEAERRGIARTFHADSRFRPDGGVVAFFGEHACASVTWYERHRDDGEPA
jgi:hypothetical protein